MSTDFKKLLENKKVLLINLPEEKQCADFYTPKYAIDDFSVYPPLGLLYVATAIKNNYPVEILDTVAQKYSIKETANEIIRKSPGVLGISTQTFRLFPMVEIIRQVKSRLPKVITVVGGPHTSVYPVETINLPGVDFAIRGDGEISFKNLLDTLSEGNSEGLKEISGLVHKDGGEVILNPINYDKAIDSIKMPDRSLLNYKYYYTAADEREQVVTMISSRGCPFRCIFCDVLEKTYRWRSAESVVDEMENIVNTFDNPIIHIFDDTFNIRRRRVLEICEEIKKRNLNPRWTTRLRVHPFDEEMAEAMKEAGLTRAHFGVESGSEISLRKMGKGIIKEQIVKAFELCKKYDIDTLAYFMIGFEWETKKDINDTIKFIRELDVDFIMANTVYPAAKTVIYENLLKSGKISKDFWKEFSASPVKDFKLPSHYNKKTQYFLMRKLDEIYLTFYLSPKFVLKNLESKNKNKQFSISEFLFKVKLASLIIKSYLRNFIDETLVIGETNEIR